MQAFKRIHDRSLFTIGMTFLPGGRLFEFYNLGGIGRLIDDVNDLMNLELSLGARKRRVIFENGLGEIANGKKDRGLPI